MKSIDTVTNLSSWSNLQNHNSNYIHTLPLHIHHFHYSHLDTGFPLEKELKTCFLLDPLRYLRWSVCIGMSLFGRLWKWPDSNCLLTIMPIKCKSQIRHFYTKTMYSPMSRSKLQQQTTTKETNI